MNEIITTKPTEQKQKLGRRFIPAEACSYPPAIYAEDVLLVDLDADRVTVDGIYLLERFDEAGNVTWMGCRRFDVSITRGVLIDGNGRGDMEPFPADGPLRIAGRVLRVYRPTDLQGGEQ